MSPATSSSPGIARQTALLLRAKLSHFRPDRLGRPALVAFAVLIGFAMLAGAYKGAATGVRVILAIDAANPRFGVLVTARLLEMALLFFVGALGVSNLIAALTTFFLARDLDLLQPMPIHPLAFYLARLLEVTAQGAWMLPVAIAMGFGAGVALDAPIAYYAAVPPVMAALVIPPAAGAVAISTLISRIVPAGRAREVFLFLTAAMLVAFYVIFRLTRPEQFIDPARFRDLPALLENLGVSNPWLPSTWAAALLLGLSGRLDHPVLIPALEIAGMVLGCVVLGAALHLSTYAESQGKAREGRPAVSRKVDGIVRAVVLLGRLFGRRGFDLSMLEKEARTVLRDPQQWTQILMLGALLVLYVANSWFLGQLPIPLPPSVQLGLNLAITGFVIGALGIRFVYPLVSLEGPAFWVLRSAPLTTKRILSAKLWTALVLLEALAVVMVGAASLVLALPVKMVLVSLVLVIPLPYLAAALGVGLGAAYPRFTYENPALIPMSFGGYTYMYWSTGTILLYAALLAGAGWLFYVPLIPNETVRRGLALLLALVGFALPWISGWIGFRVGVERLDQETT